MKLVIFGGGFCGALIARKLEKRKEMDVTLIDKKSYFEYTPSVHKGIFDARYHERIIVPYRQFLKSTHIVRGEVMKLDPACVKIENEKITFDYLVISTGIAYPVFLENKKNVSTITSSIDAQKIRTQMFSAERILIVGGGLIGTEVAGELATKMPDKQIIIVHSHDRLLERNPLKASSYAQEFLEKRGVRIIFGEKIVVHENGMFTTTKNRIIEADMCIWCAGIVRNPWFMDGFNKSIFADNRALKVNKYLQLEGYQNIFVGGDITTVLEEKTAQNAERHARVIMENLGRVVKNKPLITYEPRTRPLIISLGDRTGIMTFGDHVMTGPLPGILKWFVEWWVLKQYK